MYYEETKELIEKEGRYAYLKYVRVVDGSNKIAYRFGNINEDHKTLVGEEDVFSAGFVSIQDGELFVEGHSMTLQVGPMADDDQNISELLDIPVKD